MGGAGVSIGYGVSARLIHYHIFSPKKTFHATSFVFSKCFMCPAHSFFHLSYPKTFCGVLSIILCIDVTQIFYSLFCFCVVLGIKRIKHIKHIKHKSTKANRLYIKHIKQTHYINYTNRFPTTPSWSSTSSTTWWCWLVLSQISWAASWVAFGVWNFWRWARATKSEYWTEAFSRSSCRFESVFW